MCGRYALGVSVTHVRRHLQDLGMQVDEVPDDGEVQETYNFAPGNHGIVYLAERDHADGSSRWAHQNKELERGHNVTARYKLQAMKWGLVPFWTKRQPDYRSLIRTINCRDDSLLEDRGMWTSMKRRRRCVVVCQGFYEWKKQDPRGKEKIPHFVRRRNGELMFFAGLWDCVSFQDSEEKLYTYTIITTSSSSRLKSLHDRMPVILKPGSEEMVTWLNPSRTTWSKELQSVLKPCEDELECYAVPKEVGKVGNNSPRFIQPAASEENKGNIANFFANAKKKENLEPRVKVERETEPLGRKIFKDKDDQRTTATQDGDWSEDNAPASAPNIKRVRPSDAAEEAKCESLKRQKLSAPSPERQNLESHLQHTSASSRRKTQSTTLARETQKATAEKSKPITTFFKSAANS